MELDEYMQLTKRALTVQDITKKHFSYRLSQPSPSELHVRSPPPHPPSHYTKTNSLAPSSFM